MCSLLLIAVSSGCVPDHIKIHPVFSCCSGNPGLESKDKNLSNFLNIAFPSCKIFLESILMQSGRSGFQFSALTSCRTWIWVFDIIYVKIQVCLRWFWICGGPVSHVVFDSSAESRCLQSAPIHQPPRSFIMQDYQPPPATSVSSLQRKKTGKKTWNIRGRGYSNINRGWKGFCFFFTNM